MLLKKKTITPETETFRTTPTRFCRSPSEKTTRLRILICVVCIGRTRPIQGEQTGESGHPGDDGAVSETEGNAASGRVRGRVQAVHRTGAGTVGGTVDGRTAATVGPTHGRTPGDMRAAAEGAAAEEPTVFVVVFSVLLLFFHRRAQPQQRRAGEEQLVCVVRVFLVRRRHRRGVRTPPTLSVQRGHKQPCDRVPKHTAAQAHVEALVNKPVTLYGVFQYHSILVPYCRHSTLCFCPYTFNN